MQFRHERIDARPPCTNLGICLTTDLTGNGRPDVIIGGGGSKYPGKSYVIQLKESGIPTFPRLRGRFGLDEMNLFWYENPGWERHKIAFAPHLDVGAALGDVTGNGRLDIIAGQGLSYNDVYWFEQPRSPRQQWEKHLLTDSFEKYHDIAFGDVDNDGEPEVLGLSQESETVFYYDIPDDTYREPWPDECKNIVADGISVEGASIVDIDGDGRTEIIAGPHVFHREANGTWNREDIATGWDDTRVAVADLDGDGSPEVLLSKGDSPVYGTHPGRVAWFDPTDWEATVLADDLFCPHTLQTGDFTGNGLPDVYVAEMGLGENADPEHLLFFNRGDGKFETRSMGSGIPTHEAKVTDLTGDGRPDIVGKPWEPQRHVDVWYNRG